MGDNLEHINTVINTSKQMAHVRALTHHALDCYGHFMYSGNGKIPVIDEHTKVTIRLNGTWQGPATVVDIRIFCNSVLYFVAYKNRGHYVHCKDIKEII